MSLLEITQFKKSFIGPDGREQRVIDVRYFSLAAKAQVAIRGESGSGKTTFLHLIAGILKPDSGSLIMASIYNSINERRREIATMRALGARRATVLASVLLEAACIAALGAVAGYACVHKVPEGLALGALLLEAGLRRGQAVSRVAAVEATTLFGGVVGWLFLRGLNSIWVDVIVAHVGGGFLYLATHAVLGEIVKRHKGLVLSFFFLGVIAIGALTLLLRFHGDENL